VTASSRNFWIHKDAIEHAWTDEFMVRISSIISQSLEQVPMESTRQSAAQIVNVYEPGGHLPTDMLDTIEMKRKCVI